METELIKRYTLAVTQKLPESQRADIEKELNGLIEDMLDDRLQGHEATRNDVEAVLVELGDPAALADKYRDSKRYLIGPEVFPVYTSILKIVFFAVGIAMLVVFAIQTIINPQEILHYFVQALINSITAFVQAFAWVTGVFAVLEFSGVSKKSIQKEAAKVWTPADLPEIPDDNYQISRAEPIAGIIFIILFLVLVTFSINLLGVWVSQQDGPITVIPFFNEAVFRSFLPFIWGVTAVSIAQEIIKLINRKQTLRLLALEALICVLHFALAFYMFAGPQIWNPNFMQQLAESGLAAMGSEGYRTINEIWMRTTSGLIYLIGAVTVFELISLAVKALKMKSPAWRNRLSRLTIDQ